ncbi:hypothetical protein HO173_003276 [Letharia columbiana]|uniref:Uncharacterized protein n=1 Tax=Letharia columbiana TaxID=112416 RepID=A0A8H6L7R3_9LECA|nr:uncharacterized protein HO173_003276 [Letharia columbiana]KAF6238769.1 hypothetical protein HO173_003276 [Letharia columbiana]
MPHGTSAWCVLTVHPTEDAETGACDPDRNVWYRAGSVKNPLLVCSEGAGVRERNVSRLTGAKKHNRRNPSRRRVIIQSNDYAPASLEPEPKKASPRKPGKPDVHAKPLRLKRKTLEPESDEEKADDGTGVSGAVESKKAKTGTEGMKGRLVRAPVKLSEGSEDEEEEHECNELQNATTKRLVPHLNKEDKLVKRKKVEIEEIETKAGDFREDPDAML